MYDFTTMKSYCYFAIVREDVMYTAVHRYDNDTMLNFMQTDRGSGSIGLDIPLNTL